MLDVERFTIGPITGERVVVGALQNNCYLLGAGDEHLLVDAADEADELLDWLGERTPSTVLTTHRHHDHIGALAQVVAATGAGALAGGPDREAIQAATGVEVTGRWTGDAITLGGHRLGLIGLVGHTPGSLALAVDVPGAPVHLFTGDSLFPGGVGKTNSPADFSSLLDDVTRELFDRFDDETIVWPGHGLPTTLGAERPHLAEWRERGW